jgi:hypothetical protein
MKIYTSYFYQIRFFKPYQIPISTADWDPKWFHDNKNQSHIWKDKNGVWNGIRLEILNPSHCCSILPPECVGCKKETRNPKICSFLKDYKNGLHNKLNFNELLEYITKIAEYFQCLEGFTEEPEIILLLHESPDNLCSERVPIQELFREHNIEIEEWKRDK